MFSHDHETNKLLKEIAHELREIIHLLRQPPSPSPSPSTRFAAIAFGGNMAAIPGTQAVGSVLTATFVPIEADGVTVTPGAKLTTPPIYTIDNTAVATIKDNGDGTATITGVGAGITTVTASGGVFTDADGTVTAPINANNTDTVSGGGPSTGRTVSAQVAFS